jgi:protoheme IX farnesyltransferase
VAVKVASEKAGIRLVSQKFTDYKMLVKLRLSLTVVFSSVMAFLIAGGGVFNWKAVLTLALGGFLITGAANALNQVLEKDYDKLMKRTADRPLASGRMKVSEAVLAAGFMSLAGITLLALFNPWTSFLGTLALMSYAFVYTPLKRITPLSVVVGAIPGALPTLIGCVAAQGQLTWLGLALFGLQFFWQFPHFWSIGYLGFEDYQKAGYKIMPASEDGKPDRSVGLQSFIYTLFLYPVLFGLWYTEIAGIVAICILLILTVSYSVFSWKFFRGMDKKTALQLMFFSFLYIPVALIAVYIGSL